MEPCQNVLSVKEMHVISRGISCRPYAAPADSAHAISLVKGEGFESEAVVRNKVKLVRYGDEPFLAKRGLAYGAGSYIMLSV